MVSVKRPGRYDVSVLLRFFELPFWKERNRLYEVWTLVHFVQLLRGVTFELNVKHGRWHLTYGDSKEPVVLARGRGFTVEVWYQYKLKAGLKMFADEPIDPEILVVYRQDGVPPERLVLIECKERKDYDVREIKKLAAFYRLQAGAALNLFCNYYDCAPPSGVQVFGDTQPIVICDRFRPGNPVTAEIDRHFVRLMNDKLGIFLQAVLIDISGSMSGKDILGVYQGLHEYLACLPGSKSLCGTFADRVVFYEPDRLAELLRGPLVTAGGTEFSGALSSLRDEIQRDNPGSAVVNFFVITDSDFDSRDWDWLREVDSTGSYNITIATRRNWVGNAVEERLQCFDRVKVLYL
jgi:hypothetical protein